MSISGATGGGVRVTSANADTDITTVIGAGLTGLLNQLRCVNTDASNNCLYSVWVLRNGGTQKDAIIGVPSGASAPLAIGGAEEQIDVGMPILLNVGDKVQARTTVASGLHVTFSLISK